MARLTPFISVFKQSYSYCSRPFLSLNPNCYPLKRTLATINAATSGFSQSYSYFSGPFLSLNPNSYHLKRTLATINAVAGDFSQEPRYVKFSTKPRRVQAALPPEGVLATKLKQGSNNRDAVEALRLYDEARNMGVPLNCVHYNNLLYICSTAENVGDLGSKRGSENAKRPSGAIGEANEECCNGT